LVEQAAAASEPLVIVLGALPETEWVLRSRYRLDKSAVTATIARLLETNGVVFEHEPTLEEVLFIWAQRPSADFADCLLNARTVQLGRTRFVTFDAGTATLPRGELLTCDRGRPQRASARTTDRRFDQTLRRRTPRASSPTASKAMDEGSGSS
jgi:predicted nucleic-acid-binding protein